MKTIFSLPTLKEENPMRKPRLSIAVSFLLLSAFAPAASAVELDPSEPPFCDLAILQKSKVEVAASGLKREMAYQLGALRLVGIAVGGSDNEALKKLARQ